MATYADFSAAAADIRARMVEQWALTAYAGSPLFWANENVNPDTPLLDPAATPSWAFVEVRSGKEKAVAFGGLGNNLWRQSGEVIIRLFVAVGVGETAIREMAAAAASIFRGWQNGALKFFEASTSGGDGSQDGNYYELDVLCSFFVDIIG